VMLTFDGSYDEKKTQGKNLGKDCPSNKSVGVVGAMIIIIPKHHPVLSARGSGSSILWYLKQR
jgi:hypothetical protein